MGGTGHRSCGRVLWNLCFLEKKDSRIFVFNFTFCIFNFGENLIWFLLDYIAIMGLFVFITYYTCSVIEKSDFYKGMDYDSNRISG